MIVIYKYPIEITDEQTVTMPLDAGVLSCQVQGGRLVLWAMVDTDRPSFPKTIYVFGTGNPVPEVRMRFIDTVQLNGLVWHVFEETS